MVHISETRHISGVLLRQENCAKIAKEPPKISCNTFLGVSEHEFQSRLLYTQVSYSFIVGQIRVWRENQNLHRRLAKSGIYFYLKRSQKENIKLPLHKQSENSWGCY